MNKNQSWLNETVTRSTSVVPVHGFGMGDVRPMAAGYSVSTSTLKRHADAIKATPVAGRQPWSPPVT
jgi:hypothetical protein